MNTHEHHSIESHKKRRRNTKDPSTRAFDPAIWGYEEGTPIESITAERASYVQLVCPFCFNEPCKNCGERRVLHSDTLVIAVDGACPGHGQNKNLIFSAAGVYIGAGNPLSRGYPLIDLGATNQKAELRAAIKGLETVSRISPEDLEARDIELGTLVFKTDSAYVHGGVTDWMNNKWKQNGWMNARGEQVANRALWEELDLLIEELEESGIKVLFWKVPREFNMEADGLANDAYSVVKSSNLEKQLDDWSGGDLSQKYQFAHEISKGLLA